MSIHDSLQVRDERDALRRVRTQALASALEALSQLKAAAPNAPSPTVSGGKDYSGARVLSGLTKDATESTAQIRELNQKIASLKQQIEKAKTARLIRNAVIVIVAVIVIAVMFFNRN